MTKDFNKALGSLMQEYRQKANLTQEEVAKKLKVTKNAISHYENGIRGMSAKMLKDYCAVIGVEVQEIVDKL